MSWFTDEKLRLEAFPVARERIFLAHAGVTILPRCAADASATSLVLPVSAASTTSGVIRPGASGRTCRITTPREASAVQG